LSGTALIEETVSTRKETSGYFFITSAISSRGDITPVEVSLWTTVMASYLPEARASSTISGVTGSPHSAAKRSASRPQRRVTSCHFALKAPLAKLAQRFCTRFRTAPSITPKALEVERKTGSCVLRSFFSAVVTRPCRAAYSLMRWPTIGAAIASRTSLPTSTGPGM
jgi:hypothetical protein